MGCPSQVPDAFSSGRRFSSRKDAHRQTGGAGLEDAPVRNPDTWLLNVGWRKWHGRLSVTEYPAVAA